VASDAAREAVPQWLLDLVRSYRNLDRIQLEPDELLSEIYLELLRRNAKAAEQGRPAYPAGHPDFFKYARLIIVDVLRAYERRWRRSAPIRAEALRQPRDNPETATLRQRRRQRLLSALCRLSREDQQVLRHCLMEGRTQREAAHRMRVGRATASRRWTRARRAVQTALDAEDSDT